MVTATLYELSYNLNGGTRMRASQRKIAGVDLKLRSIKPTKSGYKFLGWSTSSGATSVDYEAGDIYSVDQSVTLYAVWGT